MQSQFIPRAASAFPLQELEQIETAIGASKHLLATLEDRREVLIEELDRLTRPQVVLEVPKRRTIGPGFEYRGTLTVRVNYIDIYMNLIRRLWTEFPDRREEMATSMGLYGSTRAYVAKNREELFPGRSPGWAQRHSCVLVDGWYVDTNLNRERMQRLLPAAVRAAKLVWGQDVKVYWWPRAVCTVDRSDPS